MTILLATPARLLPTITAHACSVCFEPYGPDKVVPRILSCGHTYCERCLSLMLQLLLATSSSGKKLECPYCKTKCKVPSGAVTRLPKNYALLG